MNTRIWHPTSKFPIPGVLLLVRTNTGQELEAIRPRYATSYKDDLDFRDNNNNPIKEVIQWSIK